MTNHFDSDNLLSDTMVIDSVDDILFEIGLLLTSVSNQDKQRDLINKPFFILIINISIFILKCVVVYVDSNDDELLKVLGDFTHMYGKMKQHYNIIIILFTIFVLYSQWVYYSNYKRGIRPTFLRLFHMMSGSVTPREVGLTNDEDVRDLVCVTRRINNIIWFNNNYTLPLCCLMCALVGFYLKCGILDTIIYGTPHGIYLAIWGHILWNIFTYQCMYFYIICKFLKRRLKRINESLIRMNRGNQFIRIGSLLSSLNSLYNEINGYNTTYWSKFLLNVWQTFGASIVILLHIIIFTKINHIILISFIYALIVFSSSFLLIIFTATSVNSEAYKSHKYLHSLYSFNKQTKAKRFRIKYKVIQHTKQ